MKKIIGKKLTDALTTSEIAWLLDAVFEAGEGISGRLFEMQGCMYNRSSKSRHMDMS